jgi:hypothetical protein
MKKQALKQVQSCQVCQQAKPSRVKYPGLIQPLPVLKQSWHSITMDFISGLPKSDRFDCILVVVHKFTEYAHFLPTHHPISAESVATSFVGNIYKLHGMPEIIISDRDPTFTSKFWQKVWSLIGIDLNMSTANHPQTDGQTERVNQCLEIFFVVLCILLLRNGHDGYLWLSTLLLGFHHSKSSMGTSQGCGGLKQLTLILSRMSTIGSRKGDW